MKVYKLNRLEVHKLKNKDGAMPLTHVYKVRLHGKDLATFLKQKEAEEFCIKAPFDYYIPYEKEIKAIKS